VTLRPDLVFESDEKSLSTTDYTLSLPKDGKPAFATTPNVVGDKSSVWGDVSLGLFFFFVAFFPF
jgi:hypothetical protein